MDKFGNQYRQFEGNYNTQAWEQGWKRCRPEKYPFGYPTFIGASPIPKETFKSGGATFVPKEMTVGVPSLPQPENTRLSWQDPDNPLTYLDVQVKYKPYLGLSWAKTCSPQNYLNPRDVPCNNQYCS